MVTVAHLRALCAGSQGRTVLVLAADGDPKVVTPMAAFHGLFDGIYTAVLCTSSDLLDDGLRFHRDGSGRLIGPTVEVCTRVADELNTLLLKTA